MGENSNKTNSPAKSSSVKSFPPQFWLVIMFEFFERGSYYGMMSVLAVYLTDKLGFTKESVGIIAGTIQPILYFLPIISGALADRFGYRRMLTIAFALLGSGYFITSQMTGYTAVFLSLSVMALGAGTFKPIISGSIARMTNKDNSTLGFGIFYWTINLGAFLFPLLLVPFLKSNFGWHWVIIAAALGTGAMLIPTIFFFKEPPRPEQNNKKEFNLIRTIANAFEIIYSPFVLIHHRLKAARSGSMIIYILILLLAVFSIWNYLSIPPVEDKVVEHILRFGQAEIQITIDRNVMQKKDYTIKNQIVEKIKPYNLIIETASPGKEPKLYYSIQPDGTDLHLTLYSTNLDTVYNMLSSSLTEFVTISRGHLDSTLQLLENKANNRILLTVYKPNAFDSFKSGLMEILHSYTELDSLPEETLAKAMRAAEKAVTLIVQIDKQTTGPAYEISTPEKNEVILYLHQPEKYPEISQAALKDLRSQPALSHLSQSKLDNLVESTSKRSFLYLFIMLLFITSLVILAIQPAFNQSSQGMKTGYVLSVCLLIGLIIWLLPGLGTFARIISTVIYLTVLSLFLIDFQDIPKYKDHFKFLLMIFLYSGFWILYFQMFGSVLWYVKAYVDASSLNNFVNGLFGSLGLEVNWFFDVEHVTVINAGTIIILQLLVSNIVKNTKALPTMITGILMGTIGMGILAISTGIWVFMLGIIIFSIGEMTAHPKFISYVGQIAPKDRVATYMGYIFLYGVIGSSIGSVLGANLYVQFVDKLHQPKTLWLIFSGIGVLTIIGLLIYNKVFAVEPAAEEAE
ncbi:MAG: MFS transporter [Methanosarcinaceae archaeon]